MFNKEEIQNMLFFDLETVTEFKSLDELNKNKPLLADLWSKRCEYLRSNFAENKDLSDEDLYQSKAALHAEFNKIVCGSFGRVSYLGDIPHFVVKSYYGDNEVDLLNNIKMVFTKFKSYKMVGHNIKRFDVPVLGKRMLINGIELPVNLKLFDKKPWEIPYIDTSDVWSFGAWQERFGSLELITTVLGIDSPKDDIHGSEVSNVYWQQNDIDRIARYCEKDVYALPQILLKISGLKLMDGFESNI